MRRSTWNSVICSSFSSYTLEPTLGSKLSSWVTEGRERGRMLSTQKAETPAASTPTASTTTRGTTIQRSHRRGRLGGGGGRFPPGPRAPTPATGGEAGGSGGPVSLAAREPWIAIIRA